MPVIKPRCCAFLVRTEQEVFFTIIVIVIITIIIIIIIRSVACFSLLLLLSSLLEHYLTIIVQQHTAAAIYRQQKVLSHFPVCCWIDWLLMTKNCLIESGTPCTWASLSEIKNCQMKVNLWAFCDKSEQPWTSPESRGGASDTPLPPTAPPESKSQII
jgi:hypothetical protein